MAEQLTLEHETEQERWEREGFDGWDIFKDQMETLSEEGAPVERGATVSGLGKRRIGVSSRLRGTVVPPPPSSLSVD